MEEGSCLNGEGLPLEPRIRMVVCIGAGEDGGVVVFLLRSQVCGYVWFLICF